MVKRQSRDQEKREICIYKKMFSIYLQKGTPIGKKKTQPSHELSGLTH